jgi:hypothetical protein
MRVPRFTALTEGKHMTNPDFKRSAWAIVAMALIAPSACGSSVTPGTSDALQGGEGDHDASVDVGSAGPEPEAAAPDEPTDLDACVPTDAKPCRDATFIALGSKCMTKCPQHNLLCDPTFWKGECTHPCAADADCQDTGSPGVCGKDNQCHRPCGSGTKVCQRTHFDCVGDPGHTYCASSFPNPHVDGGTTASDDAGDDDAGEAEAPAD